MCEHNYNYIDAPEENLAPKKKDNKTGKTVAALLAVAIIGGMSGFGGAYLQNSIAADDEITSTPASKESAAAMDQKTSQTNQNKAIKMLLADGASDEALTTKQIVEKVSPSVVSVHSSFESQSGTGTGIVLNEEGFIITNAHVVQTEVNEYIANNRHNYSNPFGGSGDIFDYFFGYGYGDFGGNYQTKLKNADKVTIVLSTDDETEYEAEIVGADKDSDLAVLKIKDCEGLELTPAEFGDSNQLTMGDKAVAIGYPLGLGLSTSEGIISGLNRTLDVELSTGGAASMTLIQTDAAINPGNSGGPLINEYGQIVGITSSKLASTQIEGMGFAIPITEAMPLISDLMNKGYVTNTTPQIGITGTTINSSVQRYYGLPVDSGVLVVSVSEGSGAEAADICAGDVIVGAEGKEVATMEDLTSAKKGKQIGDTMVLTLARADENVEVTVTLIGEDEIQSEESDDE